VRCTPSEVHVYEVHAHEMHIFKIHAYDNPSKCNLSRALHLIGVRTFRFSIWFLGKVPIPHRRVIKEQSMSSELRAVSAVSMMIPYISTTI
jgi:hypothetical protein